MDDFKNKIIYKNKTLFFDILDLTKNVGENKITVFVGDNKVEFTLSVINAQLPETDIKITHWFFGMKKNKLKQ